PRLDQISEDRLFSQLLARLQAMETLHQDKACAILANEDRGLQADLEDAFGEVVHRLGIERLSALHGHVDVLDGKFVRSHHGRNPILKRPAYPSPFPPHNPMALTISSPASAADSRPSATAVSSAGSRDLSAGSPLSRAISRSSSMVHS